MFAGARARLIGVFDNLNIAVSEFFDGVSPALPVFFRWRIQQNRRDAALRFCTSP